MYFFFSVINIYKGTREISSSGLMLFIFFLFDETYEFSRPSRAYNNTFFKTKYRCTQIRLILVTFNQIDSKKRKTNL